MPTKFEQQQSSSIKPKFDVSAMSSLKSNEINPPVSTSTTDQIQTANATSHEDLEADKLLDSLSVELKVPQNVTKYAEYLYKKIWGSSNFNDKDQNTVVAACLYIACRQMQDPRPFRKVFASSTATIDDAMSNFEEMEGFFTGEARSWEAKHPQDESVHESNSPWAVVDTIQRLQVECIEEEEAYNQAFACGRILEPGMLG